MSKIDNQIKFRGRKKRYPCQYALNKLTRKSQLKIQQMAFMLMAVFIFFILAGLFYLMAQSNDLRRRAELTERNKAIEIANNLMNSAEFSCGDYCIDADRAMTLRKINAYQGKDTIWKISSIKIRNVLNDEKEVICTEATYPDCNLIKVYDKAVKESGESSVYSFVAVCKRAKEKEYVDYKCELGKLIVGYAVQK